MNEAASAGRTPDFKSSDDFSDLVFDETIRRSLRQTPQARLEMLCASLRDAERRGTIPKRDRSAHEKHLLWLIEREASK